MIIYTITYGLVGLYNNHLIRCNLHYHYSVVHLYKIFTAYNIVNKLNKSHINIFAVKYFLFQTIICLISLTKWHT